VNVTCYTVVHSSSSCLQFIQTWKITNKFMYYNFFIIIIISGYKCILRIGRYTAFSVAFIQLTIWLRPTLEMFLVRRVCTHTYIF